MYFDVKAEHVKYFLGAGCAVAVLITLGVLWTRHFWAALGFGLLALVFGVATYLAAKKD